MSSPGPGAPAGPRRLAVLGARHDAATPPRSVGPYAARVDLHLVPVDAARAEGFLEAFVDAAGLRAAVVVVVFETEPGERVRASLTARAGVVCRVPGAATEGSPTDALDRGACVVWVATEVPASSRVRATVVVCESYGALLTPRLAAARRAADAVITDARPALAARLAARLLGSLGEPAEPAAGV